MGINGKKPRWGLAINPLSHSHHLACKFELVFHAAHVFNGGVRKCQIERSVGKRHLASGPQNVLETAGVLREFDVNDRNALGASEDVPSVVGSANIQNGTAGLVIGDKILESPLAEIFPHRHLKVDWVHRMINILKEFLRAVLCSAPKSL